MPRTIHTGVPYVMPYERASISALALLAAYGLRGRIGASSAERTLGLVLAVHLVGRNQQERTLVVATRVEHDLRADDVRHDERRRARDRAVDMGLCGGVDDPIDLAHQRLDDRRIGDVAMHEPHPVIALVVGEVRVAIPA